jgi:ATP/ADP translocase/HEAT repeat protein
MEAVARVLRRVVDVRKEELPRLLPLSLAHALVLASLYVLKPARNALFLESQGVSQLPWVLVLVAIIGGAATYIYARASQSTKVERLVLLTYIGLTGALIGFRFLLELDAPWVAYSFYIFVNIYGLLATSLIWLLANAVFNPREARRVFAVIGTGGIAGAIAGGAITKPLVNWIGTEDLLWVCVAIVAAAGAILRLVKHADQSVAAKRRNEQQRVKVGSRAIVRSDLLRKLSIVTLLVAIVAVIIEVQFNEIVDRSFHSRDEKTAFFGTFFAWLSVFAIFFQLVLTPRILRTFGAGSALLILPVSLAVGSTSLILWPGLISALLLKVGDGGFRHSIHKAATEVLFLPVPPELKNRAKIFLDTTIDTAGTGIGALVVIGLSAIHVKYSQLAFISIALIGIAIFVGTTLRRAYVDAFRVALDRRTIDLGDLRTSIDDAAALRAVLPALESDNERQVIYALEMLSASSSKQIPGRVEHLLTHVSPEVRARAINVLAISGARNFYEKIEPMIRDPEQSVRIEAVQFVCLFGEGRRIDRLTAMLREDDPVLRVAALGCVAVHGGSLLLDHETAEVFLNGDETARVELARAIGTLPGEKLSDVLRKLAADESPEVVEHAIASIGGAKDPSFLPYLIEKLGESRHRANARAAIASFGESVLPELARAKDDQRYRVRRHVPRAIGEIASQASVDLLFAAIEDKDFAIAEESLRALNRLRMRYTTLLTFSREKIDAALATRAALLRTLRDLPRDENSPQMKLLARALREKRAVLLEQIFRLLALSHPPRDIYTGYLGLISQKKNVRASALEFVENLLDAEAKRVVAPLLEDHPQERDAKPHSFAPLRNFPDPWIRACAVHAGVVNGDASMLSVLERVILLQKVDVFSEVSTEQLGSLAAIAEEESAATSHSLYGEEDVSDSMFIVLEGRVRLHRGDTEVLVAGPGDAFGTWALFDDEPRLVAATALDAVHLLRIDKEDFIDLLADNIKITQGVLKAMVRRLRGLVARPGPANRAGA